jgi:hypothetical protein
MTVLNNAITLSNTVATPIIVPDNQRQVVYLHNLTKSSNEYIHIGNSDVTLTNSFHLDPGQTVELQIPAGDSLWAMSDPDGLVVGVLQMQNRD